jgi:hypothetical protein
MPKHSGPTSETAGRGAPAGRAASAASLRATQPGNVESIRSNSTNSLKPAEAGSAFIASTKELASNSIRPPSTNVNEIRVKGINFTTAMQAVHRLYGPAARDRIERETPGDFGNALRFGGIVIGGWYPIAWYRELWKSLNGCLGVDEAAAYRIGHRAAGLSVNVAYRALSRMSSPATLLAMSARAFGYYFESGSLIVKQPEPKRLTAEWRDCHGFDNFIWSEVSGGAVYFIEATGATNITFNVLAGGGNASTMLATATWR